MTLLIADSGGTKTDWMLVPSPKGPGGFDPKDPTLRRLTTVGLNPSTVSFRSIARVLNRHLKPWLNRVPGGTAQPQGVLPDSVYFFGAGLGNPKPRGIMEALLCQHFPKPVSVYVDTDLIGAAYACLGDRPGLVGILGTGSVAFQFDGKQVTSRLGGHGYLLDDEGGSIALGSAYLRALMEDRFPEGLGRAHELEFGLAKNAVVDHLYSLTNPTIFLGKQLPFFARYTDQKTIREIATEQFYRFIDRSLWPLYEKQTFPAALTGGVVQGFPDLLKELCHERGIELRLERRPPIGALAAYVSGLHWQQKLKSV